MSPQVLVQERIPSSRSPSATTSSSSQVPAPDVGSPLWTLGKRRGVTVTILFSSFFLKLISFGNSTSFLIVVVAMTGSKVVYLPKNWGGGVGGGMWKGVFRLDWNGGQTHSMNIKH